ncbi:hypothetical protein [Streptomyces wuyuanensis]|uniref:hypothetical protein n=1 Tax=Streptomyces wuyuanensis TaxID=1196353 RepID=UPI0037B840A1
MQLKYDVDLDADRRARRNAPIAITPTVLGAPETEVTSVRIEVSHDDGSTLHRQTAVLYRDGGWKVFPAAPPSASFVSLRTTAADETGGRSHQTVIRAFGLR